MSSPYDILAPLREGKLYKDGQKEIIELALRARELVRRYNLSSPYDKEERKNIIKELFPYGDVDSCFFEPNIRVEYGYNIFFGERFYMNFDCTLLDVAKISIGNDVMFGPRVTLATPMHPLLIEERKIQQYPDGFYGIEYAKPITIGNGVWLAANVTVCAGVHIGDNAVIGAGSVVTKDIPSGVLAAGVPCKVIRKIDESDRMNVYKALIKQG